MKGIDASNDNARPGDVPSRVIVAHGKRGRLRKMGEWDGTKANCGRRWRAASPAGARGC